MLAIAAGQTVVQNWVRNLRNSNGYQHRLKKRFFFQDQIFHLVLSRGTDYSPKTRIF